MYLNFHKKLLLSVVGFVLVYFSVGIMTYADSGNARIETQGNTYDLLCTGGTITIYAPLTTLNGIQTTMVTYRWTEKKTGQSIQHEGLKHKANTRSKHIICEEVKKASIETTKKDNVVSTISYGGTWECKGENAQFTIQGFLGKRMPDGAMDTSGANTLNWIINDSRKCDFMID